MENETKDFTMTTGAKYGFIFGIFIGMITGMFTVFFSILYVEFELGKSVGKWEATQEFDYKTRTCYYDYFSYDVQPEKFTTCLGIAQ